MERIVEALSTRTNALLESPTGTGKTLCLLCASLAWARESAATSSSVPPRAPPIVVYASRTHAQLEHVFTELKRTAYANARVVLLGSREALCVNEAARRARSGRGLATACRALVQAKTCTAREALARQSQESVVGALERDVDRIDDVEDLVSAGPRRRGWCPYFFAREPAVLRNAELVLMPYNFLVDAAVRAGLMFEWDRAVIIVDEAHNLESACEDASSFSLEASHVAGAASELGELQRRAQHVVKPRRPPQATLGLSHLSSSNNDNSGPLDAGEIKLLTDTVRRLGREFDGACISTTNPTNSPALPSGSIVYLWLERAGITSNTWRGIVDKLERAVESLGASGSTGTSFGLEAASRFLTKAFALNHADRDCFRVNAERRYERGGWIVDVMCVSAGLAIGGLMHLGVRSLLLASGTLAPLDALAESLRPTSFSVRLENGHVVAASNVFVAALGKSPYRSLELRGTAETRVDPEYQRALGRALAVLCRLVPDGVLVFFPSYGALGTLVDAWQRLDGGGLWAQLADGRVMVVERPDAWDECLRTYDAALAGGRGAVFLAVCRGKASEGTDFADARARAVVVVGVPFADPRDPRVRAKMQYREGLPLPRLGGRAWFEQHAARAVNQAVGRVIRHARDFGAVLLLDKRYLIDAEGTAVRLSRWLRPSLLKFDTVGALVPRLVAFYKIHGVGPRNSSTGAVSETVAVSLRPSPAPPQLPLLPSIPISSSLLLALPSRHVTNSELVPDATAAVSTATTFVKRVRPNLLDQDMLPDGSRRSSAKRELLEDVRSALGRTEYARFRTALKALASKDREQPTERSSREMLSELLRPFDRVESSKRDDLVVRLRAFLPRRLGGESGGDG